MRPTTRNSASPMALLLTLCFSLLSSNLVLAQKDDSTLETKVLRATSISQLDVPGFSFYPPAQCDAESNLYFHLVGGSNPYGEGTIMRLSRKSNTPTLFRLPTERPKKAVLMEYSISPSGHIWFLSEKSDGLYDVLSFGADKESPSEIQLDLPKHVDPTDFVVSEAGVILLGGHHNQEDVKELRGKRFLALFDTSGRVLRDLSSENTQDVKLDEISKHVHDGAVAVGEGGTFYFLHENEIIVLSSAGDKLHSLQLARPDKESSARSMAVSEGVISIVFGKTDKDGTVLPHYVVLDEATGTAHSVYVPSDELGNNPVCFSPKQGYTFFKIEKGKVKLLAAQLN